MTAPVCLLAVRRIGIGRSSENGDCFVRKERFFYKDTLSIDRMSSASVTIDHLLREIASLPLEDQALLHEVIGHRLVDARRGGIAERAAEARLALARGDVRRGAAANLFADLETDD